MHRELMQRPDYSAATALGATITPGGSASVGRVIELMVNEAHVKCSKGDCPGDRDRDPEDAGDPWPCDCQTYRPFCRSK